MKDLLILFGLSEHSHKLIIFQPSFFSALAAFASLAMLPFIFLSHHSVLVLGTTKYLQFLCPCQKQPCTKITVLYFGRTISGLPGRLLSWSLKRNPLACKNFLTSIAGFVFLPLMRLML